MSPVATRYVSPMAKREGGRRMADLFEYLKWRGDLSFADVRLGEIDSIIFAMMSYIDFGGLCESEEPEALCKVLRDYCAGEQYDSVNLGFLMPSKQINKMVCMAAVSGRFGKVKIGDFIAETDSEAGYQFCAMTFHLPGRQLAVVYRGTDDSIAGWREDCRLSFLDEVPAQRMAVEYLCRVAEKYPEGRISLMGHSKGGNLSLYAAANCPEAVQKRLGKAYCHDGPGLSRRMVASEGFRRVERKLRVFIPQSSYIGIMFEKGEKYTVIKSNGKGPFQHDPYSWELDGPMYVRLPELSKWGKKNEEQFRATMLKMSAAEKEEMVETLFSIIHSTGAETLSDFTERGVKNLIALAKSYTGLDKEKREMMLTLVLKLFDIGIEKKSEEK